MAEVVIVDAVRTPVGRRNGGLSAVHPAELLGTALTALVERTGIDLGGRGPSRGGMRFPGRRAVVQPRPDRVAVGGATAHDPSHHG